MKYRQHCTCDNDPLCDSLEVRLLQNSMEHLTPQERCEIIKIYHQNQCSVKATWRGLRARFGPHHRPSEQTIRNVVKKFEREFTLLDNPRTNRVRNVRNAENVEAVRQSVRDNPKLSVRRRAQQLDLTYGSTWRIVRKDLGLHPYKIQLVQELKQHDHRFRRGFAAWALEQLTEDPFFHRTVMFSDEAHFWFNGYVNKQNCRIWSEENPHQYEETPLHPEKVTVWCAIHAGGVIGPYFFENAQGQRVTVNGVRYRAMLNDYFFPIVVANNLEEFWFQQDGATCHTANETIALLQGQFGDNVISRNGPVNYPPRSCDLTPCDFFLWGYVKSKVYANHPITIADLKTNIRTVIREIPAAMCENVMVNWTERMRYCQQSRGAHLNDIIFKT